MEHVSKVIRIINYDLIDPMETCLNQRLLKFAFSKFRGPSRQRSKKIFKEFETIQPNYKTPKDAIIIISYYDNTPYIIII